ncbi:hypothetical protein ISN44_As07g027040, partial [Arabidopsis suecica]
IRSPEVKAKDDEEMRKAQSDSGCSEFERTLRTQERALCSDESIQEDDCKKNNISRAQIVSLC